MKGAKETQANIVLESTANIWVFIQKIVFNGCSIWKKVNKQVDKIISGGKKSGRGCRKMSKNY